MATHNRFAPVVAEIFDLAQFSYLGNVLARILDKA